MICMTISYIRKAEKGKNGHLVRRTTQGRSFSGLPPGPYAALPRRCHLHVQVGVPNHSLAITAAWGRLLPVDARLSLSTQFAWRPVGRTGRDHPMEICPSLVLPEARDGGLVRGFGGWKCYGGGGEGSAVKMSKMERLMLRVIKKNEEDE